jgi:CheY-like chemotaxis protein
LSVTDTGRGIDPAFLPFAFERFRQADASTTRRFGGLGLGLALVRHIVELHGGTVSAESEGSGKGACFTVTLPVRATTPPPSEGASAPLRADMGAALRKVTLAGVRVLVVDDEPDALELIAAVLKDAGALVQMACTVSRGLQLFMLFQPDVLISDIGMPGEDGYSFIRRVRSLPAVEGGQTPSLALSALARGDDRARAIAAGYTAHISKPVSPEVLTAEVASLATQRQP